MTPQAQADFIRTFGQPATFVSGQPYYDHVLTSHFAAIMPDEPGAILTVPGRACAYCDLLVDGDVCRNCGARSKG